MKLRIYNPTLDPNIWEKDLTLKPEIQDALLQIAQDFYKSTELKGDLQNILFLGSSANYNWTPTSDIDLHLVIDITQQGITPDYARRFMDNYAFKWNTEHEIEIKGHPVEVYLQDIGEKNSTPQLARPGAAIYSVFDEEWMVKPNREKIDLDPEKIRSKFQKIKKNIKELTDTQNLDKLKKLMKWIRNYRDAGLAKGGEFCIENIVFKALRHSGALTALKDAINTIYDRKASLNENDGQTSTIFGNIHDHELNSVGVGLNNHKGYGKKWRYSSKSGYVFWYEMPDELEKEIVSNFLKKNYDIDIKIHKDLKQVSKLNEMRLNYQLDRLCEIIDKSANLFLGWINKQNFKVTGFDVKPNDDTETHYNYMMGMPPEWKDEPDSKLLRWRYRKDLNTVYWWSFGIPNDDEKQEVDRWLRENLGVNRRPEHRILTADADSINLDDDYWKSHGQD